MIYKFREIIFFGEKDLHDMTPLCYNIIQRHAELQRNGEVPDGRLRHQDYGP